MLQVLQDANEDPDIEVTKFQSQNIMLMKALL